MWMQHREEWNYSIGKSGIASPKNVVYRKGSETFNSSPICSAAFLGTGMNHNAGTASLCV